MKNGRLIIPIIFAIAIQLATYEGYHLLKKRFWEQSSFRIYNSMPQQLDDPFLDNLNPPFFPKDIDELAKDTSFSIQLGLISRINRMRVDLRSRLLTKQKFVILWLITTTQLLLNQEFENIHIFMDRKFDLSLCDSILNELSLRDNFDQKFKNRIRISHIGGAEMLDDERLCIIFNPDNIYNSDLLDTLEECQAICFHASLRSIPVILMNPMLMATSWSDYGPQTPLLLSDFSQVYYICDDYIMLSRQDHWFGIVQRISTGFELFFLQGMLHSTGPRQSSPRKFVRIKSWPYEDDLPDDIRSVVIAYMLQDPSFRTTLQNKIQLWNKSTSAALDSDDSSSSTSTTQQWGVYKALHDMTSGFEKRRGNWRNIKPPPTPTFNS